jgi:hypothetical protein
MEIEPKYIDLDRDKWLKEMGFDKWLDTYSEKNHMLSGWLENDLYIDEVELPIELINSLIVEWLRVKHGIWVCVDKEEGSTYWKFNIRLLQLKGHKYGGFGGEFNSPQEAYSEAFDYIKDNSHQYE